MKHLIKQLLNHLLNRLWIRLSLAFILVTQLSVFVVVALADRSVNGEFSRYVFVSDTNRTSGQLLQYYNQTGGWIGVEKILTSLPNKQDAPITLQPPPLMLADAGGTIIFDVLGQRVGSLLQGDERAIAVPINENDPAGKPVGYLLPRMPVQMVLKSAAPVGPVGDTMFHTPELDFLARMRNALSVAALMIGALGVLMGLVISRTLVSPLTKLSQAARSFAAHDWSCRLQTHGANEIAAVARAFNEMADELQRAEMLRRNMIADIAHELRTPLSVMQANLLALLDDLYVLTKQEIATLYEETCTLSRLVDDLRELARADAGQLNLNLVTVDLNAVLSATVSKFAIAAEGDGIRVGLECQDEPLSVRADTDRLAQVLGNLVANALRHTPGGSITLSANRSPTIKGQTSTVYVAVTDTGDGIPPQDVPHVFDRFYRADKSRARSSGNSGLGLAIAKAWIEAMGGQIGVESQLQAGSRFWFTLPVG